MVRQAWLSQRAAMLAAAACLFCGVMAIPISRSAQAHGVATRTMATGWIAVQQLPIPLERMAVAVGRNYNIYVFGGDSNGVYENTTYIYYPGANRWIQGAPMPTPRSNPRAVTLPDGRIAVLGGTNSCVTNYNCVALNTVEIYNPARNTWTAAAPMRIARYVFAAALGKDGRAYAIEGLTGNQVLASVEAYSETTNTWSAVSGLPYGAMAPASAVDSQGNIIAVGGQSFGPQGGTLLNDTFAYSGTAWTSRAAMPTPRIELGAAAAADGQVYAIGGVVNGGGGGGAWIPTVEMYNPLSNIWSTGVSLPQPLCCMGVAALPWGVYVIGGAPAGSVLTAQVLVLPVAAQPTASPTPTTTTVPTSPTPTPIGVTATPTPTGTLPPSATATSTATPLPTVLSTASPVSSATPTGVSATATPTGVSATATPTGVSATATPTATVTLSTTTPAG